MLRALLLEDERAARRYLGELLTAVGGVTIVGACECTDDATRLVADLAPDVVFVDVELGQAANGLVWLRALDAPRRPAIVIATAHAEHMRDAFDLGAVDYLLKPWSPERVAACVSRLRERVARPVERPLRLVGRIRRTLRLVAIEDVLAFQAADRLVFAHLTSGDRLDLDVTLATLEASGMPGFLRVHRQWLVQLARVLELDSSELGLELAVGVHAPVLRVPVAGERAREVRAALLDGAIGLRRA